MITYSALFFATCIVTFSFPGTDAHGYLKSPRSRNYVANQDGKWSGGTANDPKIETCPHCLNQGGICGTTGNSNYNTPLNTFGDPMPVNIQANLQQGQEIDLSMVITAHHKGHIEYKACAIQPGEVPTQDCFDAHPLEFVEDKIYNFPKDTNYPERAYIPTTGNDYTHTFKLPADLNGNLVLIQWVYVTANSCLPPGYRDYPFPPGQGPPGGSDCYSSLGEQFWNCAEVRIAPSNTSPVTPPVTTPTDPPVTIPTNPPAPVPTLPPVPPTAFPTKSPVQAGMCPSGYSGMIATVDCKGFYHCQNGSLLSKTPTMCQTGLLFNQEVQVCDWASNVACESNPNTPTMAPVVTTARPTDAPTLPPVSPVAPTMSPIALTGTPTLAPVPPNSSPTYSPIEGLTCPPQYTGLIPANDCTEFYHCLEGSLVSYVPIYCPDGLLYKVDRICMCNFVFVL